MTIKGLGVIRKRGKKKIGYYPRIEVGADCLGLGKTTAVKVLTRKLKQLRVPVKSSYELAEKNPYLRLSYDDPSKGLLKSQKWFIKTKYGQVKNGSKKSVFIQDVHPEMDYNYALTNALIGRMSKDDFKEYNHYFNSLNWGAAPAPDLLVYFYLNDDALLKRTRAAAEEYEKMKDDYYLTMKQVNGEWIKKAEKEMNVLKIDLADFAFHKDKLSQMNLLNKVIIALKGTSGEIKLNKKALKGNFHKRDWDKIKRKKVIITCGLPGSGKSYFAKEICKKLGYKYLASDTIRSSQEYKKRFGEAKSTRYINSSEAYEKNRDVHYQVINEMAINNLKAGKKVVIDATFLGPQRQRLIKTLEESGYLEDSLFLPVKADELVMMHQMLGIDNWPKAYTWFAKEVEEGRSSYPDERDGRVEVLIIKNSKMDDFFGDQGLLQLSKLHEIENKEIIIMSGLPGSGKGYIAKKLRQRLGCDYLSTDKIRHSKIYTQETNKFMSGVDKYEKSRDLTYQMMPEMMIKKIKKGKQVILDGTYIGPQIKALVKILKEENLLDKAVVLLVRSSEKITEKRIDILRRKLKNGQEHAKAWRRSYDWFIAKLKTKEIRFPNEKIDGVRVMEIWNQ